MGRNWNAVKPKPPPPLLDGARCRTHPDPDLWFSTSPAEREAAKRICAACPVVTECAEWSILAESGCNTSGVIGAMTPGERRAEHKRRRLDNAA